MRKFIFGAVLLAVAAAGLLTLITDALSAAQHDKPATFSARFVAVYKS